MRRRPLSMAEERPVAVPLTSARRRQLSRVCSLWTIASWRAGANALSNPGVQQTAMTQQMIDDLASGRAVLPQVPQAAIPIAAPLRDSAVIIDASVEEKVVIPCRDATAASPSTVAAGMAAARNLSPAIEGGLH